MIKLMQLKKINQDHYVVVDENADINENDFTLKDGEIREVSFLMQDNGDKIITSTQPLETIQVVNSFRKRYDKIKPLDLSYVKSLVGEVDVEKKGWEYTFKKFGEVDDFIDANDGFIDGYNQCLEDNKDKRFSEEDIMKFYKHVKTHTVTEALAFITQPKDTWECFWDSDNNLKLK